MSYYKSGEKVALRDGFGEGFLVEGANNDNIIGLTADLTSSVKMTAFAEKFPSRFFNVGIQEQNMATVAAGLALEGFTPFIGSFGNFQPGRNLDQIRTSICMMNANVKIVSSHTGFSYGEDGVTIQMLEDIGIMRSLPNMKVIVPADANQAAMSVSMAMKQSGPVYIRLGRAPVNVLSSGLSESNSGKFEFGKGQLVRDGNDVTIIAISYMLEKSLEVAKELAKDGIDVRVINMHTIKPLDKEIILKAARETRGIVTAEDHQKSGGLGSAVAEVISQSNFRVPMRIIGVDDRFGETGSMEELMDSRGLSSSVISENIRQLVK